MSTDEKRKSVRVPFRTEIEVHYEGTTMKLDGDSVNLSMRGILVESDEKVSVGTACQVRLSLTGTREPMALTMQGEVVRHDASGFGIQFAEMDLDSYSTLKEIVRHNVTGDADLV